MTRHREISIIVERLIIKGVIDEKKEFLARQAVYEGLIQIRDERKKEREEEAVWNLKNDS